MTVSFPSRTPRDRRPKKPPAVSGGVMQTPSETVGTSPTWASTTTFFSSTTVTFADT